VTVIGQLPQGLPSFAVPWIRLQDLAPLLLGALTISVVSFADTSVLSRSLAAKTGAYVDPNQEIIGLGAANVAAGFFQGFPISSSASRTPVAESAGSKTQVTGLTGAAAIALLLVFAPSLLKNLPNTALAAVVIASAIGLFETRDLRRLYRIQRWEFWLSIACFLGVAIFGPIPGILFAIIIALLEFVWDGWRPHYAVLGRVDGMKGYHDITCYPDARLIPGLLLFRWDAPLFFANAEMFHEQVLEEINKFPTPVSWFVVTAEPVTSVDVTAADMLAELDDELCKAGIQLVFAKMKDPVKDKLNRFGLFSRFDEGHFFLTNGQVVNAYLDASGITWEDGEERK
jgi:MFS superfamily sulfate permease-like transporter